MQSKIVELRERSERQLRRARRTALIVAGAGAALGVAAVGAFVIYRLTRPTTAGERARRLVPRGLRGMRRRMGDRLPPMRLYVGNRQVGEEPGRRRGSGSRCARRRPRARRPPARSRPA